MSFDPFLVGRIVLIAWQGPSIYVHQFTSRDSGLNSASQEWFKFAPCLEHRADEETMSQKLARFDSYRLFHFLNTSPSFSASPSPSLRISSSTSSAWSSASSSSSALPQTTLAYVPIIRTSPFIKPPDETTPR